MSASVSPVVRDESAQFYSMQTRMVLRHVSDSVSLALFATSLSCPSRKVCCREVRAANNRRRGDSKVLPDITLDSRKPAFPQAFVRRKSVKRETRTLVTSVTAVWYTTVVMCWHSAFPVDSIRIYLRIAIVTLALFGTPFYYAIGLFCAM